MKICRNCGKEIPDDVKYCGYCGALQTEEAPAADIQDNDTDKTVNTPSIVKEESTPEVVDTNKETENDNEPTVSDEAVNTSEETEESENYVSEEKTNTETESVPEVQVNNPESSEKSASNAQNLNDDKNEKTDHKKVFKQAGKKIAEKSEPVIDKGQAAVKGIDWNEFKVYHEILQRPFETHEVKKLPLWTGLVIMVLGSWYTFGSFGNGLFVLIFSFAGSMIAEYIGSRGNDEFHAGNAFIQAFCSVFIPFIAVLAAGIFLHTAGGDISTIARRLGLIVALGIFAAVMLGVSIAKKSEKMSPWLLVLLLSAVYASIAYYMLAQYMTQINGFLSMF